MTHVMNELQKDAIREMSSIGAGNAATALSQMIKKKVDIEVPQVSFLPIDEAAKIFGPSEAVVSAVCLRVLGDIRGIILISFDKNEALHLSNILLGWENGRKKSELDEMGMSALKEVSTILGGSYLNALSKMLNMKLLLSLPSFAEDMAGALIENVLAETNQNADYAIIVNTDMSIVDEKIVAYFLFIPEAESLEKVMKAIGVEG